MSSQNTTVREVFEHLKTEFIVRNEEIKTKIAQVEESLEWEEAPTGKNKKEFRMLHSKEAKMKTIQTLRNDLLSNAQEMEEFQSKLQDIMKGDPQKIGVKLQREILVFKKHLPVYRFRSKVLESIHNFDVTVLIADTGSGKSTLIPQFIFGQDESLVTYCAQPRRLAAHGLADYTKDCLGFLGKDFTVATDFSAWDTNFDPKSSRIIYTTNFGMLHKWRNDKTLIGVDTVVIDEAHERNLATDLLLGIMKEVLMGRRERPIKVVVMSATIDPSLFCNFFANEKIKVNYLSIPGKTFPVDMIYDKTPMSDNPREYLTRTIKKVKEIITENESGDILGFLATPAEIDEGVDILEEFFATLGRDVKAFPLHGNVESDAQKALFKKNPSVQQQRVILATKIAETSVTLPDIMFVVDSGRQKEFTFDLVKNIGELSLNKISKASSIQRAGRAGRVGPGVCYRLYQQTDYEGFLSSQSPEIRCLPLDQSLLSLFYLGFTSPSTFQFIDPPDPAAVEVGISSLISLNAITKEADSASGKEAYELTTLGSKMAKFNIDPRLAHLIVNTVETDPAWIPDVLVICGMVSSGGNVFYRYGNYEEADFQKLKFCHPSGDFITMLEAFKRWTYVPANEQKSWTKRNYVSPKAMFSVKKFYSRSVTQINKIFRRKNLQDLRQFAFPVVNSYDPLLKLIFESFKRSTAVFAGHFKTGYVSPVTCQRMVLHPSSSINKLARQYPRYICYDKVMTTNRTSIFHASEVKPEWIEDEASFYTDFVKASLVEHVDDYPRLGNRLIRNKIMRRVKALSSEMDALIAKNAKEKAVTNFYQVYLNWDAGVINTYCHLENKSILVNHVNRIIEEAVEGSKAERTMIPLPGTRYNLNVGMNGLVNELILPGNFLSIRVPMYDFTPDEVTYSIKMLANAMSSKPKVRFLNPFEAELMFTNKEDARQSYELITSRFPNIHPKWNTNMRQNEAISIRIYLKFSSPVGDSHNMKALATDIIGNSLIKAVDLKPACGNKDGKNDALPTDILVEAYSFVIANDIGDQFTKVSFRRWNACLKCTWTVPTKVSDKFKDMIKRNLRNCEFEKNGENTKIKFMEKRLALPLADNFIFQFKKISFILEGTSFSRPEVPIVFDLATHTEKLRQIEEKYDVAILQDKYSQEYSLKIFGTEEDSQTAITDIDSYLATMKTVVADIFYSKEKGTPGLLLELLKVYGTNLHRLSFKKGIGAVEIIFSKGIVRISGKKDAVAQAEEEIAEIAAKCPAFENVDEENTCGICFVAPDRNDSYRLDLCGHLICLHQCFKMLMTSSDFPLSCPREGCAGGGITIQDMYTAFSIQPDVKKVFRQNCFKHFMDTHKDFKNCPVVNCQGIYKVHKDDDDFLVTCDVCLKDICTRCMVEYHKDISCAMYQRGEKNDLTDLLKRKIIKLCPNCEIPLEKNGGCERVFCKCGVHLCWYCLKSCKTANEVYGHSCPVNRMEH